MSGILSGPEILFRIENGEITIDPFDRTLINPASIDLRLGNRVCEYVFGTAGGVPRLHPSMLDCKREPTTIETTIPDDGLVIYPNRLYLMHTLERIHTDWFVSVLDGKSSIGRLGICVHLTAGYGDPGFDGQYTLEVTTVYPVRIYAGMRFCQMRFHTTVGKIANYREAGNYVGAAAMGPVPSRVWKQFR